VIRWILPLAALVACHSRAPVLVGPPDVGADATDTCHLACAKLETNRCGLIGEPGCTDNCERDQSLGIATQLDPMAVLGAATLDELGAIAGTTCQGAP